MSMKTCINVLKLLKAKGTSQFDRLCSKMPENALTELLKHHMARPADRAFKKAGLHVEKLEHALQLLNVYLPRVVLVNNAEDLVDQASLFLQNAARASVEEPGVFSLEQNIQEELTGQMPNPELRSSSPNKEKHACLELTHPTPTTLMSSRHLPALPSQSVAAGLQFFAELPLPMLDKSVVNDTPAAASCLAIILPKDSSI